MCITKEYNDSITMQNYTLTYHSTNVLTCTINIRKPTLWNLYVIPSSGELHYVGSLHMIPPAVIIDIYPRLVSTDNIHVHGDNFVFDVTSCNVAVFFLDKDLSICNVQIRYQ